MSAGAEEAHREIAAQLGDWVSERRAITGVSSLFNRSVYAAPDHVYDQMKIAKHAVEADDVVGSLLDTMESLALDGVAWESDYDDDDDIFNQINRDVNLDAFMRGSWRELNSLGQFVAGIWWGWKDYKVRGFNDPQHPNLVPVADPLTGTPTGQFETERDPETNYPKKPVKGQKRKRKYHVWCPIGLTILDSSKIVPVGSLMFGKERLAFHATPAEMDFFQAVMAGNAFDPMMENFFIGPYKPNFIEAQEFQRLGIDYNRLILLNPDTVFRHTLTKGDYDRWATIPLKRVFRLLDLKQQLLDADRSHLVGAANYILLVRIGDPALPGTNPEIQNLKDSFQYVARLPVIVADHRLQIDILTPKTDHTLSQEKYAVLNNRIQASILGTFTAQPIGRSSDDELTIGRLVAKNLQSRRHMLKRTLEREIGWAIVNHPRNASLFDNDEPPGLSFHPRNINLQLDPAIVQALLALHQMGDLSRETTLEELGFDQNLEAARRLIENAQFDHVFKSIASPFASPENNPWSQGLNGASGGRPPGGGSPPQNGKPTPKTSSGATKPGK